MTQLEKFAIEHLEAHVRKSEQIRDTIDFNDDKETMNSKLEDLKESLRNVRKIVNILLS